MNNIPINSGSGPFSLLDIMVTPLVLSSQNILNLEKVIVPKFSYDLLKDYHFLMYINCSVLISL